MKPKYQALNAGILVAVLALGMAPVYAGGNQVAYTFTFVDIAFGAAVGGSLFADGTARGHGTIHLDNGATVVHAHVEAWTLVPDAFGPGVPGVSFTFEFHVIKGELPPLGPLPPFSITGTPVFIDFDMDGNPDLVVRITPAN